MELELELYRKMYLIRAAEVVIQEEYDKDGMKTPMHMSMGSEFTSAAVLTALGDRAQVFSSYRSHAPFLARTDDVDTFFAEMYGKRTGTSEGKGGSMHLAAPDKGFMYSSGIVASTIPIAVGAAYANKVKQNGKIAVVFFGDGATNEGNFWESLNLACVLQVPVLFVCEDNGLAVHTGQDVRNGYGSLQSIVGRFDCIAFYHNLLHPALLHHQLVNLLPHLAANIPCFLHVRYCRYLEHVGVYPDWDAGYRNEESNKRMLAKDALDVLRRKLIEQGFEDNVELIEDVCNDRVARAVEKAKAAPFAGLLSFYRGVYHEED